MAENIHEEIEAEREAALPNAEDLVTYRRYARGKHEESLTPYQSRVLQGILGNDFCDNVVGRVLSELRNRLRLDRFDVAGEGAAHEAVKEYLSDLWTLCRFRSLSGAVHYATMRDGDHAVSLAYLQRPNGERRVSVQREGWWNGKYGMFVAYDDYGLPSYAFKDWKGRDGRDYRTIYYDDRLERYRKEGDGWRPYALPTDPEDGVVPWTMNGKPDGEPLGLPVVHFANIQVPQDPTGQGKKGEVDPLYGGSELAGGLLGLQDEINDIHRDITANARFNAYQMTYGTGIQERRDEEGKAIPYTPFPGAFFQSDNPDARFGRIEAGDVEPLRDTLRIKIEAISRGSSVPMFAIQGEWPSGEALIRAEMPLIDKVETIAASVGPAWASVAHKATRLHNAFGGGDLDEDLMISAVFGPMVRRDELTQALIAEKKHPHISEKETLRILGYSPEDIERIMTEREEERAAGELVRQGTLEDRRRAIEAGRVGQTPRAGVPAAPGANGRREAI